MPLPLAFFPQTREPFGRLINVMVRLSPLDEFRLRNLRKDIYAPRVHTQAMPNLELVRGLGTSNTEFIRKTLFNIAHAQSKFEVALSNPFLVDRSVNFSLHLLAYAPALKILRNKVRENLRDIVVVNNPTGKHTLENIHPYLSKVGTFPWPQDTKILLKPSIPPEDGDAWLDHAKRQASKRLNPVTAIGLTMVIYNHSHRVKRHDERMLRWMQVQVKDMRDSDIVYEEFPFEGEGFKAFDTSER
ncbi:uncharacterized protein EAF01_001192 [Botrytis porri]|uniref:Uncharacterized protein n=1 Tax=Botrytis porri TaxID=87229 RepID=A0A4Z1KU52_9HELO|nr:uncharacterized protein EAF01_001192 [Botrytis porri]KAF7912171.1 hypothetical protein EAF01_001192 [Botrytis porri]TGO88052.1 hypothetical protein BPOR_0187g00130 [Botrytis porri]